MVGENIRGCIAVAVALRDRPHDHGAWKILAQQGEELGLAIRPEPGLTSHQFAKAGLRKEVRKERRKVDLAPMDFGEMVLEVLSQHRTVLRCQVLSKKFELGATIPVLTDGADGHVSQRDDEIHVT